MKTKILQTDWFLNQDSYEGTVTFEGKNGDSVRAFSHGTEFIVGAEIDVEIESLFDDVSWDVTFSGNSNKEIKLVRKGDWSYEAYGKVLSINPVVIDFGEFELNTGNWTNDSKVVGEFVYWKIERLDILKI